MDWLADFHAGWAWIALGLTLAALEMLRQSRLSVSPVRDEEFLTIDYRGIVPRPPDGRSSRIVRGRATMPPWRPCRW